MTTVAHTRTESGVATGIVSSPPDDLGRTPDGFGGEERVQEDSIEFAAGHGEALRPDCRHHDRGRGYVGQVSQPQVREVSGGAVVGDLLAPAQSTDDVGRVDQDGVGHGR